MKKSEWGNVLQIMWGYIPQGILQISESVNTVWRMRVYTVFVLVRLCLLGYAVTMLVCFCLA